MGRRADRPSLPTVIIGAGLMGRFHTAAAHDAGARIIGVVDRDPAAARRLAGRFRGAVATTSLRELLADARLAHVCTPPDSHAALADVLAGAGIHALVEKPIAESANQAEAMMARFAANDRFACPTHQYAFQQGVEQAIGATARLGAIRRVDFDICSAGGGPDPSRHDAVAGEILPHPLSMLQRLLPAVDIATLGWTLTRAAPGEWLVAAEAAASLVSIAISLGTRPTCFRSRVQCERGTIELNNFHGYAIVMPGGVGRREKIAQPFARGIRDMTTATANLVVRGAMRESSYPGLRTLVRRFHQAAAADDAILLPITPAEIIAGARARDTILGLVERERARAGG